MYFLTVLFVFIQLNLIKSDVIDPLSNHNLGTANEALKNQTNSTENIGPCQICRYSAKSFTNVSNF